MESLIIILLLVLINFVYRERQGTTVTEGQGWVSCTEVRATGGRAGNKSI